MRIFLFECHQEHGYSFEAILGNHFPTDHNGPIETHRVICDTAQRHSKIPVRLLRKMAWSQRADRQPEHINRITSYLSDAFLTPISVGLDARSIPGKNMNFITLGYKNLNRLAFFILLDDEKSPRRFGFKIEELEEDENNAEDESETETDGSSDDDLLLD